jgi:hypothetical protein
MLEKESSAPLSSIETAREPVGLEQEWKYESTMIAEAHPLTLNELKASYRTMRIEISEDLKEEVTGDKKEKYFEIVVTGVYKRDTILLKSDEGSLEAFHSKVTQAILTIAVRPVSVHASGGLPEANGPAQSRQTNLRLQQTLQVPGFLARRHRAALPPRHV